jgi:hypothetical protein
MSGIYLLLLIAIWLLVGWIIYRVWRRWKPIDLKRKVVHIAIGALLFSFWFGGAFWEVLGKKEYYDAQVRELCAQDGGVSVYETVELPAERFTKWGQINFYHPTEGENALGPEYLVKDETRFLRAETEDPTLVRHHFQVFRRTDGKLLGERIAYGRGGGDLPGSWHPSSFSCPDPREGGLLKVLFTKSNSKGGSNE